MRIRNMWYMVLSMIIYIRNIFCEQICNSDFHDVASRTVLADIVFVGQVRSRQETYSPDNSYNATMKVKSVLKGSLPLQPNDQQNPDVAGRYGTILVGPFGHENRQKCVFDIGIGSYIVFLDGRNSTSLDPTVPFYRISSFPEPSAKSVRKIVRRYHCPNCSREPEARIRPLEKEVQQGRKIKLKCKVSGKPPPLISWRKDNSPLNSSRRVRIRHSKHRRTSRLEISNAAIGDEGIYTCEVKNARGTDYKDAEVIVTETNPPVVPHAIPCLPEESSWCLHSGKCYRVQNLNHRFCVCSDGYTGYRCRDRDIFDILQTEESTEQRQLDRALTITGLIITAVVLGGLILAAFLISKKKRQNYRSKQAAKRQEALSDIPTKNGTYGAVSMEAASAEKAPKPTRPVMINQNTQTEEMMNASFLGLVGHVAPASTGHGQSLGKQPVTSDLVHCSMVETLPGSDSSQSKPATAPASTGTVDSDPEQQSKRSSPSQSSKTESAHAHMDQGLPLVKGMYDPETGPGSKANLSLELDQHSDYDNQPHSDMEFNIDSETEAATALTDTHDSSDTDASSSIGEEQALFQYLQSNPRVAASPPSQHLPQASQQPDYTWAKLHQLPNYTNQQYAFNPYARGNDNDVIPNRYFQDGHNSLSYSSRPSYEAGHYDRELPYDPDPDATVV